MEMVLQKMEDTGADFQYVPGILDFYFTGRHPRPSPLWASVTRLISGKAPTQSSNLLHNYVLLHFRRSLRHQPGRAGGCYSLRAIIWPADLPAVGTGNTWYGPEPRHSLFSARVQLAASSSLFTS